MAEELNETFDEEIDGPTQRRFEQDEAAEENNEPLEDGTENHI